MEYSGLRLLVDVGVGRKVERWLQEHGCDVKNIRDINPWISDKEILKIMDVFSVFKNGKLRIRR